MATTPKAPTPTVVCDISGKQAHLGAAAARGEFPLAEPGASEE